LGVGPKKYLTLGEHNSRHREKRKRTKNAPLFAETPCRGSSKRVASRRNNPVREKQGGKGSGGPLGLQGKKKKKTKLLLTTKQKGKKRGSADESKRMKKTTLAFWKTFNDKKKTITEHRPWERPPQPEECGGGKKGGHGGSDPPVSEGQRGGHKKKQFQEPFPNCHPQERDIPESKQKKAQERP